MAILASMGALASAACPTSLPAGKHEIPLSFANENRKFFLKIPDSVDVTTERPLVISWHGCGSSPEKFEDESLLDVNVGNYQMYNIYPEGTTTGTSLGWNAGWDAGSCQTSRENPPDDIEFAKKILQWVDENMCVDMEKVFIAGFRCLSLFLPLLLALLFSRVSFILLLILPSFHFVTFLHSPTFTFSPSLRSLPSSLPSFLASATAGR
jgi:hypothetical protein